MRLGVNGQEICDSCRPVRTWTRKLRNVCHRKPLSGDNWWSHSRLRRPSVCCSELAMALQLIVVTSFKSPINPITNPNPMSSLTRNNIVTCTLQVNSQQWKRLLTTVARQTPRDMFPMWSDPSLLCNNGKAAFSTRSVLRQQQPIQQWVFSLWQTRPLVRGGAR
jgi:hypothetical protein